MFPNSIKFSKISEYSLQNNFFPKYRQFFNFSKLCEIIFSLESKNNCFVKNFSISSKFFQKFASDQNFIKSLIEIFFQIL